MHVYAYYNRCPSNIHKEAKYNSELYQYRDKKCLSKLQANNKSGRGYATDRRCLWC